MNTIYILLALQIADLISTVIALRNPKLKEVNGLLSDMMAYIGTLPALIALKTAAMVLIWHHRTEIGDTWMGALCVLYVLVIVNNMRLIIKTRNPKDSA